MYSFLLQDWITVRSASGVTTVTQSEACWLDLSAYQDVVAWLDVKNFTASGATVNLAFQSAASKDESMFLPVTSALSITQTGVSVTVMIKDLLTTPLARWLRWQLSISGSPTATWDATFRILIVANAIGSARAGVPATAAQSPPPPPSPPLP